MGLIWKSKETGTETPIECMEPHEVEEHRNKDNKFVRPGTKGDKGDARGVWFWREDESEPVSPAIMDLIAAQARAETAVTAAFRRHPQNSKDPRDYPKHVATMARYFRRAMVAETRTRHDRDPKSSALGAINDMSRTLARIHIHWCLKRARY